MSRPAGLEGSHHGDVVILGAGLVGCLAAGELVRRGRRVIVLETEEAGARSGLGLLSTGPSLPYRTVTESLGRSAARELWDLHREGHQRLRGLLAALGRDHGYAGAGGFLLAETRDDAMALADSEDLLREDGFAGEFLDHYMLETRFDVRGFTGGYWAADDGSLDVRSLARHLAGLAASQGVHLVEHVAVESLEPAPGGVVVRAGRGSVAAETVLVADDAVVMRLVPALAARIRLAEACVVTRRHSLGPRLPSPARTTAGAAWVAGDGGLEILRSDLAGGEAGLASFTTAHFPDLPAGPALERPVTAAYGTDSLPLVGPLPGTPVVAACALGPVGEVLALQAAAWAAESAATGRDGAPEPLRASRPPLALPGPTSAVRFLAE